MLPSNQGNIEYVALEPRILDAKVYIHISVITTNYDCFYN